jgi:hypothetical protein
MVKEHVVQLARGALREVRSSEDLAQPGRRTVAVRDQLGRRAGVVFLDTGHFGVTAAQFVQTGGRQLMPGWQAVVQVSAMA